MTADDINSDESLAMWIESRPLRDSIGIVQRTALRVVPILGRSLADESAKEYGLSALSTCRVLLTAGVGSNLPSAKIEEAARIASNDAAGSYSFSGRTRGPSMSVDAAAIAGFASIGLAPAEHVVGTANEALRAAVDTADYIWEQVRDDARMIEAGADPFAAPLWSIPQPVWFRQFDAEMRAIWAKDPPARWSFWERWWDGVLSGQQLDWELQQAVALIEPAIWDEGPDTVAEEIRRIEELRELRKQVADLAAKLDAAFRPRDGKASFATRAHNNPPELVDVAAEIAAGIEQAHNGLDDARVELQKASPSRIVLVKIGQAILKTVLGTLEYIGELSDIALKETAKKVGPIYLAAGLVSASGLLKALKALAELLINNGLW